MKGVRTRTLEEVRSRLEEVGGAGSINEEEVGGGERRSCGKMVMRYGKIKKHLRTIHANHDLTIRKLLLGVSLHFWKSFHVFPHFQLKDISIF